jgi:trigger factor
VRAIVDELAQTFEDPEEVVRWYYSQPQRLAEAEALAIEDNVVELGGGQRQDHRQGGRF